MINEPGLVGTIRTHTCSYGYQEPYNVAVLNVSDSPIAEGIEFVDRRPHPGRPYRLISTGYSLTKPRDEPAIPGDRYLLTVVLDKSKRLQSADESNRATRKATERYSLKSATLL